MKVVTTYDGPNAIVHVEGRLDAEWAAHLAGTLDELLRSGVRSALMNLTDVTYVSSAGARVVTASAREFAALRGELRIAHPPPILVDALGHAGLEEGVFFPTPAGADGLPSISTAFEVRGRATRDWLAPATRASLGNYETSTPEPGAALTLCLHGNPAHFGNRLADADDCHAVSFSEQMFGLGIGALGDKYEDCGPRLGELVGVAGVVAFLPTDGAYVPDYLTTLRGHPPRALLAYGLTCEGGFSHLIRFSARRSAEPVPLAELADVCLDTVGADATGVVMIAETAGLVGAWRRRSPAAPGGVASFGPDILRDRLTFTAEPAHAGTTALITGVIARDPPAPLGAHVRPLRRNARLLGHFHAAVFSYRPVPQRTVGVHPVVASLFEEEALRAVLHLIADDRDSGGAGESRFVRGLVWAAPLNGVTAVAQ